MAHKKSEGEHEPVRPKDRPTKSAAPMPSLIVNSTKTTPNRTTKEVETANTKEPKEPPPALPRAPSKPLDGYNRTAKKIMWFGVASFSLVIIILWGWAFKLQLSLVNFTESPEGVLIKKTKTDWDQAFAANKKEINQKETIKQEIKTVLNQIITNASATTTAQTNNAAVSIPQP